ncbi:MAG: acyl-CoA thioesterase [Parcubacteria group bacterium]|nr:acyl-CoA thioesterase [Parcubacteria group bacterium]|tara:strand:- start:784 stop:1185 length:402 start_codon:yes stop_codon:yes gene_type:complete
MELISTHFVKKSEVGYHGNLFGGVMLAWIDEAAAAFAAQVADTPRMVTKHIAALTFEKPVRPGQIIKIYGEVDRIGKTSLTLNMEVRRHSVYNGTQCTTVRTKMTFVRIDGDGEAIPISEKVRQKYRDPTDFT